MSGSLTAALMTIACTPDVEGTPVASDEKQDQDSVRVPAPKPESQGEKPNGPPKSAPKSAPTDTSTDPEDTGDASTSTEPPAESDAGAVDAAPPPPPEVICAKKKGAECRTCCYAATPGGTEIEKKIKASYDTCLKFLSCGKDTTCQTYCRDSARSDVCFAAPECAPIDECITKAKCT